MSNYLRGYTLLKAKMSQTNLDIFLVYQISKKNAYKFEIYSHISLKLLSWKIAVTFSTTCYHNYG